MSKHKWQSKLVSFGVAAALVLSLVVVAVPVSGPVMASPDAKLTVNITAPAENTTFSVCDDFDLTFTIKNTGDAEAEMVNATVFPSSKVNVVGLPAGQSYTVATWPSLAVNATVEYTVEMHCAGADEPDFLSSIHVMPAGEEEGVELPAASLHSMIVHFHQVFGVLCEVDPNPTKVCHNTTFTATVGTGADYPVAWNWTFGDGESKSGSNEEVDGPIIEVIHHYAVNSTPPGNFTACVTVTDSLDITAQCCKDVEVYPKLAVSCNATPNPTKEGHEVEFAADAVDGIPEGESGCVYSWSWDFGDGVGTSTDEDPTYTYDTAGNYTAIVTLDDGPELGNTANCSVEIRVYPGLGVTCDADPKITKIPHCVNFTAEAVGGIPSNTLLWHWDITNEDTSAVVHTAGTQNVTCWKPASAGNYSGTVTVEDKELGNSANCTTEIVRVYGGVNVTCNAEPDPAHVCQAVNFTAEVTGGWPEASYNWTWEFRDSEDDLIGTASTQNTTFTFMCVGNYSGFVTACDNLTPPNCGNCTANVTVIIEPPGLISPPNGVTVPSGEEVCFEWEDIGCCNYTLQVWQKEYWGEKVWLVETGHDNTWCGPIMDGNYRWWVIATDMCGNNATSEVQYFGVQESNIDVHVTRPDGGEEFAGGETETITWDAAYVDRYSSSFGGSQLDLSIAISYSSDSGATWTGIATGEENDGVYAWSVPPVNSDQCLVKVVATDDFTNLGVDTSDNEFSITTAVVVSIPDTAVSANTSVIVPINITGVTDLASVDIWLNYDKDVVTVTNVTNGDLGTITSSIDNTNGVTKMNWFSTIGWSGDFVFANIELRAVGSAGESSALDLDVEALVDSAGVDIPHGVEDGVFTILALMEGDVNLNSHVTIVDAMFIAQYGVGYKTLNADQLKCGDTFDDGATNILDAFYIAQWLVDPTTTLWDAVNDADMLPPVP